MPNEKVGHASSEADVEAKVVAWATDEGFLPFKLNLQGNTGWPDRLWLFAYPLVCFIEFKRPGEELRRNQPARVEELVSRGYPVGVFDNVPESIAFLAAQKDAASRRQADAESSRRWAIVEARARKNLRGLHDVSHPSRKRLRK